MNAPLVPLRLLLVDDSAAIRGLVARVFNNQEGLIVEGTACNGQEAVKFVQTRPVDVVILDIEMPVMDWLAAIPELLKAQPKLKIIMFSTLTQKGAQVTLQALRLGAIDFVAKPSARLAGIGMTAISEELLRKVRGLIPNQKVGVPSTLPLRQSLVRPKLKLLAIGSSTGGPNALSVLLHGLGPQFTDPILIVQHMPPVFTQMLAERLQIESKINCREVKSGEFLCDKTVYIAPGDHHIRIHRSEQGYQLLTDQEERVNFCRPAVDPLFISIAKYCAPETLAVVLTGMGEDGKAGAKALVDKGGQVYVQDEASCVVWGMPRAIAVAGLASRILPLNLLAPQILKDFAKASS